MRLGLNAAWLATAVLLFAPAPASEATGWPRQRAEMPKMEVSPHIAPSAVRGTAGEIVTPSALERTALAVEALEFAPIEDICETLVAAADASGLPPLFFLRLIWKESRFDNRTVSSAGALGLAQFMPRTAAERGLDQPFDPISALWASAYYLREHVRTFGNLGLAAMAYNAGSGRVLDWLSGRSKLPEETRKYVSFITGNAPEKWIDASELDIAFDIPQRAPCGNVAAIEQHPRLIRVAVKLEAPIVKVIETARAEAARKIELVKAAEAKAKLQAAAQADQAKPAMDKDAKIKLAMADDFKGKLPKAPESNANPVKPQDVKAEPAKTQRAKAEPVSAAPVKYRLAMAEGAAISLASVEKQIVKPGITRAAKSKPSTAQVTEVTSAKTQVAKSKSAKTEAPKVAAPEIKETKAKPAKAQNADDERNKDRTSGLKVANVDAPKVKPAGTGEAKAAGQKAAAIKPPSAAPAKKMRRVPKHDTSGEWVIFTVLRTIRDKIIAF